MYLTPTMFDDLAPQGVTREHLKIANNKKMPKTKQNILVTIKN